MSAACVIIAVGEVSPVRIGSLFSGYGGLDMAVSSVLGGSVAWHVEYDKAPSRILAHHYPTVPNYGDVTQVDFTTIEPVDVLTGGYPCQPFSHAGLRKGTDDERHLWPHVLRAIREMGPRLAILENVRGHLSLGFDVVLADLADLGWSARWGVVRASDAGACHQRARLFIVAYPDASGLPQREPESWGAGTVGRHASIGALATGQDSPNAADAKPSRLEGCGKSRNETSGGPSSQSERRGGLFADAHLAGSQARGTQPHRAPRQQATGQRQPMGSHAATRGGGATSDASGQRHGRGQDAAMVGRLGATADVIGREASAAREVAGDRSPQGIAWGDYGPAIARWEHVTGRPAPTPTEPGRTGNPRLAPRFVEWMMGLPDGHVTDPAIGISRNDQLKALGNGVVPQQAALALDVLLKGTPYDLRQRLATI